MQYVNLMDQVCGGKSVTKTGTCEDCGKDFQMHFRAHSKRCKPCQRAYDNARQLEYQRRKYREQRGERVLSPGVDGMIVAIIAQAAEDAAQQNGMAMRWLREVGVEWLGIMGYDDRGAREFVRLHACAEQPELPMEAE